MSEPTALDMTDERLREIISGCDGVTPGPWRLYDGSSWRRIGTVEGRYDDCAVVSPHVASDGHPDMGAGRGQDTYANLEHIARLDPQTVYSMASELLALRQEVERLTRERDEARELAQLFSQADRKPDWIARAETAETALRLSTQRREDVVRALELLVASVGAVIVELKPGQSLSPAGAGRTNAMISDLNAARRALQPKEN